MFVPPPITRTKKCARCELRYPVNEVQCSHCKNLTDQQVVELKLRLEKQHQGNANLGKLFIYLAILTLIGMVIILNT